MAIFITTPHDIFDIIGTSPQPAHGKPTPFTESTPFDLHHSLHHLHFPSFQSLSALKKIPLSTLACKILILLTCPVLLRRFSHSIFLVLYDLLPRLLCLAFLGRHCKQNTHSHSPAFISLSYSIPLLWKRDLAHVTPVRQQNRFDSAKPMFIPGKSRAGEALINGISMRLAPPT